MMMEVPDNFCRACLTKYDENGELLQYTEKNRRQFIYSTGLQVKRNDILPFQLCKDCYINMKMSCKFRKLCRSSDKKLKNFNALKEVGEVIDFCTFLKNNDDTFRFPFMNGYSTPMLNKSKEDDNESTTTSIRNFMTDMLHPEDLPDTEARIIREVIEEEADILDDSLDSHWLQEDMSIDTDFQLDFSLNSPFSTPRPKDNDEGSSPKLSEEYFQTTTSKKIVKLKGEVKETIIPDTIDRKLAAAINVEKDKILLDDLIVSSPADFARTDTPTITDILFKENINGNDKNSNYKSNFNCIPDHTTNENYIDENSQTSQIVPKVGQRIENFENVLGDSDISQDFFGNKKLKLNFYVDKDDEINKPDNDSESEEEYITEYIIKDKKELFTNNDTRGEKYMCPLCENKYKTYKILEEHMFQVHCVKITKMKPENICTICGMSFRDPSNFNRHVKRHSKEKFGLFECDICKRKFTKKQAIELHMRSHLKFKSAFDDKNKDTTKKKFLCTICGSSHSTKSNLNIHIRRHNKKFSLSCVECGQGYYRKIDLNRHMAKHTKVKPYKCEICQKMCCTMERLRMHIRCKHTDERPYKCEYCPKTFVKLSFAQKHQQNSVKCIRNRIANSKTVKRKPGETEI